MSLGVGKSTLGSCSPRTAQQQGIERGLRGSFSRGLVVDAGDVAALQPDSSGMGGPAGPKNFGAEERESPRGPEGARCCLGRVELYPDVL